jgi:hypothetical protein
MKKVIAMFAILAIVGGAMGAAIAAHGGSSTQQSSHATAQQTAPTEVSYKGVAGQNALALLTQSHKVTTKSYAGVGEMVTSIDGVVPDSNHFWSFYVNGQQAQVGADAYATKDADTITWKLEALQ